MHELVSGVLILLEYRPYIGPIFYDLLCGAV